MFGGASRAFTPELSSLLYSPSLEVALETASFAMPATSRANVKVTWDEVKI